MVATITEELAVGINPKIRRGVEIICELHGIKPSTYVRQLIVRDLIKEGIFESRHSSALIIQSRKLPPSK